MIKKTFAVYGRVYSGRAGVTETFFYRSNGSVVQFKTSKQAAAAADDLNERMNSNSTTRYIYSPVAYNG